MTAILDLALFRPVPSEGAVTDHTTVGTVREAQVYRLAAAPLADARDFAAACAWDWRLAEADRDTLVLVVGELASNALEHAVWPTDRLALPLRLVLLGRHLIVEVRDPDVRLPRWPGSQVWDLSVIDGPASPDAEELTRGHGLGIVSALADDLCALAEPSGKVVRAFIPVGGAR